MKKIAGVIAVLLGTMAVSQAYAEFIPATYFTNCKLKIDAVNVPNGNNTHVLSDQTAWNTSTVYFAEQTDSNDRFVNERYFEAFLHETARVDSVELWAINNQWNLENQTIRKIKVKYLDPVAGEWKWAGDEEEFPVNYVFDAGMNVYRGTVTLPETVETYRVRIYLVERTKGNKGDIRLDEFRVNGTPTGTPYQNNNILYQAKITATGEDTGVAERIADGKMDKATEISSGIGTPENPYEIVFDFDGQNYSWNSFNMISEYIRQGITDMKLQYSLAGHWVDAKEFTYDLSTSNAYAMGTLENPIMYGGYLETPVSSDKFRLLITGCKSSDSFRIGELMVNGAKSSAGTVELSDKITKTAENGFIRAESLTAFTPKAILIQSPAAGNAEIGYFENDSFVPVMQNVTLSEGENFILTEISTAVKNLAVKFEHAADCTLSIYGTDEYAALDGKLEIFKTEKKYSEYESLKSEIEAISDADTKAYYEKKLEDILAGIVESQSVTVSGFDAAKRTFRLDASVYGADQSQVTVLIKAPSGAEDTQTLTLTDGKLTGTLPVTSAENGTYTITVKAFSKDLTATLETRAVYEGTDIKTFSLDGTNGTVSGTSIKVTLPAGSTRKDRVPGFTLSDGAKLYFGEEELKTGETKIDFTNDVKLKVVAENGTEKTYTVSVTIASSGTGGGGGGGSSSGRGNGSTSKTPTLVVPTEIKTPDKKDIFSDVPSSHWANKAITKLYENKVVSGVSETEFDPGRNVTREEFIVMLLRAKGILAADHKSGFADAAEHWSSEYVAAAFEAGIVSGIDSEHFGIGMNMTREDACAVLFRSLGETSEAVADFSDADEISDYAKAAVGAMQKKGYVSGFENAFMPKKNITRAEAAQMIANVYFGN